MCLDRRWTTFEWLFGSFLGIYLSKLESKCPFCSISKACSMTNLSRHRFQFPSLRYIYWIVRILSIQYSHSGMRTQGSLKWCENIDCLKFSINTFTSITFSLTKFIKCFSFQYWIVFSVETFFQAFFFTGLLAISSIYSSLLLHHLLLLSE